MQLNQKTRLVQDFVKAVEEADDFVAKGAIPRGFSPSYVHPEPALLPAPQPLPPRVEKPKQPRAPPKPRVQKPKKPRKKKDAAEPLVRVAVLRSQQGARDKLHNTP